MFIGSILLLALLTVPDDADTLRTEHIEEVIVTSNSARQRLQSVQAGAEQLQLKELTTAPQLFGETDIMRSIQLLPGIKAESDASSSFQVRGGTSAQNLVLFDNCPVYNVGHLAGRMLTDVSADRLAFSRSPTKIGLPRSAHHSFRVRGFSRSSIGFMP